MTPIQRVTGRLLPYRVLIAVSLTVFVLDQLTKLWIVHLSGFELGMYPPYGGQTLIPNCFSIVYSVNTGAAWGMFEGYGMWLVALGLAAVAGIILLRHQLELSRKPMQWAFGLLIGGIIGNLVDRAIHGHVIDFLDFHLGSFYRWPTFNVADSGIVVGVGIYMFLSFRIERAAKKGLNVRLY